MLRLVTRMLVILVAVSVAGSGVAAAQQDGALAYGETATGVIDDATPEHFYTFSVQAGDSVAIAIAATSGDLDTLLLLTDESGVVITQDDDSAGGGNSLINYTFAEAGVYRVTATRYDRAQGATSGAYMLTLAAADDEFGALPDLGVFGYTTIGYGEAGSGIIDDGQTAQAYAFPGHAGETVTVSAQRTSGDLALMVALFDRTGTEAIVEVEDVEDAGEVQFRHILPETAYYVIGVGRMEPADGVATAGEFEIRVDVVDTEAATPAPAQVAAVEPALTATEQPAMEITLRWSAIADLDLVLYYPSAADDNVASIDWQHVAYPADFPLPSGATFETDGNGFCQNLTTEPVERITWAGDSAPSGAYEVLVWHQFSCGSAEATVPFELTITIGGETQTFSGSVDAPKGEYRTTFVRP